MRDHEVTERWLPVVGWEGSYEVSSLGQVRSIGRTIRYRDGRCRVYPGKLLAQTQSNDYGHLAVSLSRGSRRTLLNVHTAVATAFLGPRPTGMQVRHGAGGRQDNRVTNLSYGTARDNSDDMRRDGTHAFRNQTVCLRGHALTVPNLVPCLLKNGWRSCLACSRGRSDVRTARQRGEELDLQMAADRRYSALLEAGRLRPWGAGGATAREAHGRATRRSR